MCEEMLKALLGLYEELEHGPWGMGSCSWVLAKELADQSCISERQSGSTWSYSKGIKLLGRSVWGRRVEARGQTAWLNQPREEGSVVQADREAGESRGACPLSQDTQKSSRGAGNQLLGVAVSGGHGDLCQNHFSGALGGEKQNHSHGHHRNLPSSLGVRDHASPSISVEMQT